MPRALRAAAAVLAALTLAAACTSESNHRDQRPRPRTDSRPNIVFVLTDDLSTDLVRYMPHVQALAQAGATFSDYFVVDSLCCPSRASILTGQYPHNTKIFYNSGPTGGWNGFDRFGDAARTFGITLQHAGYRTGFLGKYLNLYDPIKDKPARGWDEWDVTGSEGYREYRYHLNQNGHVHYYGDGARDYLTDVLSQRAVQVVDRTARAGRPLALEVATFAPHQPAVPAPRDVNTFPRLHAPRGPEFDHTPTGAPGWLARLPALAPQDVTRIDDLYRKRVESVQAVDRMVGVLEQALRERGLLTNTYFVFSSDNGFHMGQYRMLPGKQTAFDTDIRVPLIVAGPGIAPGRTIPDLASSIDLAPTFDAIAGGRPSYPQDGASLLGLLHGQPAPADWRRAALIEHRGPTYRPDDPDRQRVRAATPPSYEAMRTRDAVYVEYVTGEREYYDLRRDPHELDNLAPHLSSSTLAGLHRTLVALERCAGETCRTAAAAA